MQVPRLHAQRESGHHEPHDERVSAEPAGEQTLIGPAWRPLHQIAFGRLRGEREAGAGRRSRG